MTRPWANDNDPEDERRILGLDPDPLRVTEPDDLWDPKLRAFVPRPSALWALLVGIIIGVLVGALLTVSVVHATPRPVSLPVGAGHVEAPPERDAWPVSDGGTSAPTRHDGGASPSPTPPVRTAASVSLTGISSWYATSGPGLYAAAGPPLRTDNWRNRWVVVSANGRSVRVQLTDWCACRERLIDLSGDAFARLAPLSVGLVRVVVTWAGPGTTPPPTDVTP